MADYTLFPFELYTTNEIAQMMIQSVQIDDAEFAAACREQLERGIKPPGDIPDTVQWVEVTKREKGSRIENQGA